MGGMVTHTFEGSADRTGPCRVCGFPYANGRLHLSGRRPVVVVQARPPRDAPEPLDTLIPRVGFNHPEVSYAAARRVLPRYGSIVRAVLDLHCTIAGDGRGLTDDEAERVSGRSHQSVSAARNALMRGGWLEPARDDAGEVITRPVTATGNPATVWVLTPQARAALVQPQREAV